MALKITISDRQILYVDVHKGSPSEISLASAFLYRLRWHRLREYRTYYHIGLDWGLSESAVCRTVSKNKKIKFIQ